MISEKFKCRFLIKDVGIKSRGDDFVVMDIMVLLTFCGVTRGRVLSD